MCVGQRFRLRIGNEVVALKDGTDELTIQLAKHLKAYEKKLSGIKKIGLSQSRSNKKISKAKVLPIGTRGEQYLLLKEMYQSILDDARFTFKEGIEKNGPVTKKVALRRGESLSKIVRASFSKAYVNDARSKRQRATVWSAVLLYAWKREVKVAGIRVFILDHGGIIQLYNESKG